MEPKIKTMEDTIEALKNASKMIEESNQGLSTGACLFIAPNGESWCRQMTSEQCAAIKGNFIGGPCT